MLFALALIFSSSVFAQSKIEGLIPAGTANTKESVAPMPPMMVHVDYTSDINETQACQQNSTAYGGLKVQISWYNTNDETGKMMLGMVSNPADLQKHWDSHKEQLNAIHEQYKNGNYGDHFNFTEVLEETVPGGKLYMISSTNANCDTDKPRSQRVTAKCFFFNGTTTGNIEIEAQCTPEEMREMVKSIIKKTSEFNFPGLMQ